MIQLFDIPTTVDPSHIISLIRKLLPLDGGESGDCQGLSVSNDSSQRSQPTKMEDTASSPILNNLNGNIEAMKTQCGDIEQSPSSAGIDSRASPGNCKKSAREEAWEESGCILWDLAANKEHAEFMVFGLCLLFCLDETSFSSNFFLTHVSLIHVGWISYNGE